MLGKRDELDQLRSRHKNALQLLNLEHERLQRTQEHLAETQRLEQDKRQSLQAEKNRLAVKAADLGFTLQQLDIGGALAQQKQLWQAAERMFSEEVLEEIRARFEKVKDLSESELMMDSNTSDHQLHMALMMRDNSVLEPQRDTSSFL